MSKTINRREFLGTAAVASTITILPRHVLGGTGHVAPSDKLNLALIGSGTMALNMLRSTWLPNEHIHISSLADPNKDSNDYRDWSPTGLRDRIREFLQEPNWGPKEGVRAGREAGKEVIEIYYRKMKGMADYKCNAYSDYRELLDKEQDLDVALVMTPEHWHGTNAIDAMNKGLHVVSHKTLANVMQEVRLACNKARETGLVTHLMAWNNDPEFYQLQDWLHSGVIGTVREVHNWSNRPVWPQGWLEYPQEKMKVPKGMDWDLWLGPVPDMPYHLDLTHALFRGWYHFGSGCLGDMGNYSLSRVYRILDPGPPLSVETHASTGAMIVGNQSQWRRSEVAYPHASTVHFTHKDLDIYWYDGGMKPNLPRELHGTGEELGREGMLFVGDYGKILGDFHGRRFKLLPEKRMEAFAGSMTKKEESDIVQPIDEWITAIKEGKQSRASYQNFQALAEATCLANVGLRYGKRLEWDSEKMKITNEEEANQFLYRQYRPGYELGDGGMAE